MLRDRARSLQPVGLAADTRHMSRRLTLAVFAVLLAFPATAAADERDNARTFADVGLRAVTAIEAAQAGVERDSDSPPRCVTSRRLRKRGSDRQVQVMTEVYTAHWIARFTRAADPAVARAAAELQAVPTADPALKSGRTAWRRVHRMYARIAALAPAHYCSLQRDYVRNGFHVTPAIKRALRTYQLAMKWDTSDIDKRLAAAVKRLVELGVPAADADAFDGELDD
jgi:hypothetical protein